MRQFLDSVVVVSLLALAGFFALRGLGGSASELPQAAASVSPTTPVSAADKRPQIVKQRIDQIDVCQKAWVEENPTGEQDLEFGEDVDPETWRLMILRAVKSDGGITKIRMVRPLDWLEARQVEPGASVDLEVAEIGIDGPADVLDVLPCPPGRWSHLLVTAHSESKRKGPGPSYWSVIGGKKRRHAGNWTRPQPIQRAVRCLLFPPMDINPTIIARAILRLKSRVH